MFRGNTVVPSLYWLTHNRAKIPRTTVLCKYILLCMILLLCKVPGGIIYFNTIGSNVDPPGIRTRVLLLVPQQQLYTASKLWHQQSRKRMFCYLLALQAKMLGTSCCCLFDYKTITTQKILHFFPKNTNKNKIPKKKYFIIYHIFSCSAQNFITHLFQASSGTQVVRGR